MEEKNINGEQPILEGNGAEAQRQEENLAENESATKEEGSLGFGKFKTARDLLAAYESLEAEFTKKSQKLKLLEKESTQNADNTEESSVPVYEGKDWIKMVQQFYENNPKAKGFEKEISSLILSDKLIAKSASPLEDAWKTLASKNYKTEDEIAGDNDFLSKYVLNNPAVQETVLKSYLEKMQKAPKLIASSKNKQINVAVRQVPKNLEQAKSEVEKLFS